MGWCVCGGGGRETQAATNIWPRAHVAFRLISMASFTRDRSPGALWLVGVSQPPV